MVDGSALLMTMFHSFIAMGIWEDERGSNMLDTGAHFYDAYETADGKYVSIGSIEPQFYAELLEHTGLDGEELPVAARPGAVAGAQGAAGRDLQARRPATSGARSWRARDVCFAPGAVADRGAASTRTTSTGGTFVEVAGIVQPGAGAPLQPHAGRGPPPAAPRRPAHRRGPRRLGRVARAHRRAPTSGAVA